MQRHIKRMHKNLEPSPCIKCEKVCRNLHSLNLHMKFRHEPSECPVCHKEYKNIRIVERHLKRYGPIHDRTRKNKKKKQNLFPIYCPQCFNIFKNLRSVKKHQKTEHEKKEKLNKKPRVPAVLRLSLIHI